MKILGCCSIEIDSIRRTNGQVSDQSEAEAVDENINREVELLEEDEDRIVDENIVDDNILTHFEKNEFEG